MPLRLWAACRLKWKVWIEPAGASVLEPIGRKDRVGSVGKVIPDGLRGGRAVLAAQRPQDVLALTEHGGPVTAMVAHGNVAGTQFHPEKSQKLGLKLITNFLSWAP